MMAAPSIIVLGAGGDGLVVVEALRQSAAAGRPVNVLGFLDDGIARGSIVHGARILGGLSEWREAGADVTFVMALHKIKQMPQRMKLIEGLGIPTERWARVLHPSAVVAADCEVGAGAFLAQNVVVQPSTRIGRHASIRAGANLGHDTKCADFSYMGPNSTLCGKSNLETGAHLGPNSVLIDGVTVEPFAVIGAGTVVTTRVPAYEVYFGVPARKIGVCGQHTQASQ